jgi:hypothetical protein
MFSQKWIVIVCTIKKDVWDKKDVWYKKDAWYMVHARKWL